MRRKKASADVAEPLLEMGAAASAAPIKAKAKAEWTPDGAASSCSGCEKSFTLKRRKHHCRHCGGLFCNDCCNTKFKRNLAVGDGEATKAVRVCNLCWHSLELLAEGPLDPESPLAIVTSNDQAHQPEGQILALIAVAKHGSEDAQSALARKVAERLGEPEIPVKLKALRLTDLLAEDSSSHFKALLKHDATNPVRALTRFTVAPDPELGDKPATACRNAAMKCLATLEALTETRAVIGRPAVAARTDANSMKSAMRIAKRRAGAEWDTYTAEQKRLAIENVGEESPRGRVGQQEGDTASPRRAGNRTPPSGAAKVVGAADVGALLGEVDDTASAGSGHGRGGGRPTARAGGGAAGRGRGGSLNTSRPASPDSTSSGRSAGARGWSPGEAQQQLQAQRLDDNQAEIERRDEEIANIEQTVDDIKEVFADLAVLVENQDEQVDAVEENVEQVVKMTEQAGEELMTAERYQKSSRKCTLMLFLIVLVGLITILVQLLKG